jgi:hypothetical protein
VEGAAIMEVAPFIAIVVLKGSLLLAAGSHVSIVLTHDDEATKKKSDCMFGGHP